MPRGEYDRGPRKAQTRAALLRAAAKVYAAQGFEGATLDEVAAEAGYSKGAVYAHFGSKENLLLALWREHIAASVAEQLALYDPERATWDRPLRGSERFMERLDESPEIFRLFVELWSYAQRDERLRAELAGGFDLLRATIIGFAQRGAADAGVVGSQAAGEGFADVTVALGVGMAMIKLLDPGAAPPSLLGGTLSLLVRALESSPEARALLAVETDAPSRSAR